MKQNNTLYFDPFYTEDFLWMNKYHLRLGSVTPNVKSKISQGLKNLSNETIRFRFMGPKKEFSTIELDYLTELDGWNHFAFGLEEVTGRQRGVGIVRLVRSPIDSSIAEVAIVIIDEYQKIGLGTLFIEAILLAAYERKLKTLSFSILPANTLLPKLLQKVAPCEMTVNTIDIVQYVYHMDQIDFPKIKESISKKITGLSHFPL